MDFQEIGEREKNRRVLVSRLATILRYYILVFMSTITTSIQKNLEEFINCEICEGRAASKAHVVRNALNLLREERAFERIREAEEDIRAGRVYQKESLFHRCRRS